VTTTAAAEDAQPVRPSWSRGKTWATVVIVVFLLAQMVNTFEIVELLGVGKNPQTYPFLRFNMYSNVYHEGDLMARETVTVRLADGREVEVGVRDTPMTPKQFGVNVTGPIRNGDVALLRQSAVQLEDELGSPIVAFTLRDDPLRLTEDGFVPAPDVASETTVELGP
jgi:hypothetical protein